MKTILHLGSPKSGSTSLQHSLAAMRDTLREIGFFYPTTSHGGEDFHHVLTGLYENYDVFRENLKQRFPTVRQAKDAALAFLSEAFEGTKRANCHTLILSSELLFPTGVKKMSAISAPLLKASNDVAPIVYIREPASLYKSEMQQRAKRGVFLPPFKDRNLRWRVEQIESAFGRKPQIRGYSADNLVGGDVSRDFFSKVLELDIVPPVYRSNSSMSAEAVCALISIGKAMEKDDTDIEDQSVRRLAAKLRSYQDHDDIFTKHDILPELKRQIRKTAVDYLWLKDNYDIEFKEIDYANIEKPNEDDVANYNNLDQVMDVKVERVIEFILKANSTDRGKKILLKNYFSRR